MNLCAKDQCTGCLSCRQVCPKDAIKTITDNFGFSYPIIEKALCIECGKCRSVCHVCSPTSIKKEPIQVYRYKGPDEIRINSSSGGFFSLIAKDLLKQGYNVVGVLFDEDYMGVHYEITNNISRINLMRKSKYVEAKLNGIFIDALKLLSEGGKVFFVGVPCHVAAFLKLLNGKYSDQVITMDLVCFGNGSPSIYEASLRKFAEKNHKSSIRKVDFRHKPFLQNSHTIMDILADDKEYTVFANFFPYYYGYKNRLVFRESCYGCLYHSYNRVADITIGDVPGDNDPLGENVVLCNTKTGSAIIEELIQLKQGTITPADDSFSTKYREHFSKRLNQPELYQKIKNCSDNNIIVSRYLNYHYNKYSIPSLYNKIKRRLVKLLK